MFALVLTMAAIAFPDALNPTLIVTDLYLAVGERRTSRTAAFATAAFVVTFAGGLAIAFGLAGILVSIVPKPSPTTKYALLLAAGIGLTIAGVAIWLRRRALVKHEPARASKPARGSGSAALLGAGIAGVELLSAFPYFAAIAVVVGASVSTADKVLLLALYNLIYVLPLIAITIVCAVMGPRADAFLEPIARWTLSHWPHIVAPLAAAAGIAVTIYAAVRLA